MYLKERLNSKTIIRANGAVRISIVDVKVETNRFTSDLLYDRVRL